MLNKPEGIKVFSLPSLNLLVLFNETHRLMIPKIALGKMAESLYNRLFTL